MSAGEELDTAGTDFARTAARALQAAQAVVHKVVKKLEPKPLADYVDHTTQFYLQLP